MYLKNMVDVIVKKEIILFKDFLIVPDKLYPTFTGWYCHIYNKTDTKFLCLINHSNWINGYKEYNQTKDRIIAFVKQKLS